MIEFIRTLVVPIAVFALLGVLEGLYYLALFFAEKRNNAKAYAPQQRYYI